MTSFCCPFNIAPGQAYTYINTWLQKIDPGCFCVTIHIIKQRKVRVATVISVGHELWMAECNTLYSGWSLMFIFIEMNEVKMWRRKLVMNSTPHFYNFTLGLDCLDLAFWVASNNNWVANSKNWPTHNYWLRVATSYSLPD